MNYWLEALDSSLDEHCPGISITKEQREAIARDMELAKENYGMAFYQPENPLIGELKTTKAALEKEREKVGCRDCAGSGRLKYNAGPWGVNTQCDKCRGEGKHAP